MLFGVRVTEFRKSVSMNNLSQYDQHHDSNTDLAAGYASDDVVHASGRNRERKRGVPWSEEEHRLFLLGLQKVGKGDWRGISRNFVKTRTPTQVASHAQKYFLRRSNANRRRRRSSLFDLTTETCISSAMEEDQPNQETTNGLSVSALSLQFNPLVRSVTSENRTANLTLGKINQAKPSMKLNRPIPILPVPPSSKLADLNLNQDSTLGSLPLSLSLPTTSSDQQSPDRRSSAFESMSGGGDGIISVA